MSSLDSLPIPPIQKLKRSASTASLPTPPRTRRRKLTSPPSPSHADHPSDPPTDSDASDSPAPLLLRLAHRAPISPPPSRRLSHFPPPLRRASPPATPKRPSRARDHRPVRDSPNNPFLAATPLSLSPRAVLALESPRTPGPADCAEKPTITYVFRGVKAEFANPLYKPEAERAATAGPATPPPHTLPLSDPEYSPDMRCPPRLLFRAARRLQGKKGAKAKRGDGGDARKAVSEGELDGLGEGEGGGEGASVPGKLTFDKELELLERREKGGDASL